MTPVRFGLAALLTLFLALEVRAQETVDVSRLPISVERIQRELKRAADREEHEGLNLRYIVSVYGQAPPIVVLGPQDDLVHGPVPRSAPTHREMIEHVTPREYRAPAADLGALMRWLAERARK
jgi:hypothetical protein